MNRFIPAMPLLVLLLLVTLNFSDAQVGVCNGMLGNNLPSPPDVVALYKQNNIQGMRLFDPHLPTLQALGGSDISVVLGVRNEDLESLGATQANADAWVQTNVKNFPTVKVKYIGVGNEISPLKSATFAPFVLPAMKNIATAISNAGLVGIKVSPVVSTEVLGTSYPPSAGAFAPAASTYMTDIVGFLVGNGAPLLVNIYPYFAYINNKAQISLDYALFRGDGVVAGGVKYQNLFSAILDAMYSAVEKSGGPNLEIVVTESGWPSAGGDTTTMDNAKSYYTGLVGHVKDGTPKRPGRAIETYLFAMFDENQKTPEYEKNFGVFTADKQPKYPINFS
ncbi:hypothetical protein CASFOL_015760 [Castilleja foliolosa]|uniref:Glucan endo-1,3-beta-D-glucosidase n=1 Tax=Castilleja foliolosa TaxID=1961234 RepID=A0ABD3DGI6_9LAMI